MLHSAFSKASRAGKLVGSGAIAAVAAGFAAQQHLYNVPAEHLKPRKGKTAVVIGGGVIGFCTARELARQGYSVRVLESLHAAAEGTSKAPAGHVSVSAHPPSFASFDFVRKVGLGTFFNDPSYDLVEKPEDLTHNKFVKFTTWLDWNFWAWSLAWCTCTLYSSIDAPLMAGAGERRVKDMKRSLLRVASEENLIEASSLVDNGGRLNISVNTTSTTAFGKRNGNADARFKRFNASQTASQEPLTQPLYDEGAILESHMATNDAYGSCADFTKCLAARLIGKYGVRVDYDTEVLRLETVSSAKGPAMAGVRLASGELVSADVYVLAAGANTPMLAVTAGVHVPITAMRGYKLCAPAKSKDMMPKSALSFKTFELYVTPLLGEVHFASYGEFAPHWDRSPTKELESRLEQMVQLLIPQYNEVLDWDRRYHIFGSRPQTVDGNPIVGPTRVSGLYINTGHCSYGFMGGALYAQLLANGLRNGFEENGVHQRLCSLSRFQPLRPSWSQSILDVDNMPCLIQLAQDRS